MQDLDALQELVRKAVWWRKTNSESYLVSRSPEHVPETSELRRNLIALGVKELKYFQEGLDCIQYAQAPRAAIVLGWTGFIDLLQARIYRDSLLPLNSILKTAFRGVYKKVGEIRTRNDLVEHFDDALLLEAGRKLGLYDSHIWKQLDAMRDERNNCAHVEEYAVTVRIALGFYAHLVEFLPRVI